MVDINKQKIYDRMKINKHATKFYTQLYNECIYQESTINITTKKEPEFLIEDMKNIVNNLKNNKLPEHDEITNKYIKRRRSLVFLI